ncbi:MAG: flagellar hook-associated protein FlgL [Planctomycetota bacterium]|jgi:flagellar hook-associated protein 3 FlgL
MSGILGNIYNNTSFALNLHTEALARLQEQVASGSRINRASDDPSAAYRILGLNSQERSLQNYVDNLLEVVSLLDVSYTAVDSIKVALSKITARLSAISGSVGATGIAEEVNNWLEDIVLRANTNQMGQYLFGGSDTATSPYVVTRTDGKITSVTYQGSLEDRSIEVAPGVESSAFQIGDNVFRSDKRSDPIFPDTGTGAAAGTGTSTVRGDVWLTVTGSVGNYDLSIDGGLTTVNTDGTDTNLAVTDSRTGQILYVDTTGINSTGVDWVRVPGTYDIFNAIISIRDRLETPGGLTAAEMGELQSNGLKSLSELSNLLLQSSVSTGSKIGFLDDLKDSLNDIKYDTQDEVTRIEEADIAQIAIDLSRREVLYQMSLSVAAKLMSMSLLDFLR